MTEEQIEAICKWRNKYFQPISIQESLPKKSGEYFVILDNEEGDWVSFDKKKGFVDDKGIDIGVQAWLEFHRGIAVDEKRVQEVLQKHDLFPKS